VLRSVSVSIGTGDARRCSRCHSPQPTSYRESSVILEEIANAIADWPDGPGPGVILIGAEPFGHRELPGIVTGAVGAGVVRLALETDGIALAMGENAAGVLHAGVRHARLRLHDGAVGADEIGGQGAASAAVRAGVEAFRTAAASSGIPVAVTAVIELCPHSASSLPTAVAFASELGACAVTLEATIAVRPYSAVLAWTLAACDTGTVNGVWVEVQGIPPCLMGEHAMHCVSLVDQDAGVMGLGCSACSVDPWCAGLPEGVPEEATAVLTAPPDHEAIASRIARANGGPA
jgi:hypothetical protein